MLNVVQDMQLRHEEMIVAACIVAVTEIDKKIPTPDEVTLHLGKVVRDGQVEDYLWKKRVIIRAHPPQIVRQSKGRTVVNRKIEQVWQIGQKGTW